MGAIIGKLGAWLLGGLGVLLGGWKTFLLGVFLAGLTVLIYNSLCDFIEEILNFALQEINAADPGSHTLGMQLTGLGAYLADKLRLVDCMGWIVSCMTIKITLKCVPFLRF